MAYPPRTVAGKLPGGLRRLPSATGARRVMQFAPLKMPTGPGVIFAGGRIGRELRFWLLRSPEGREAFVATTAEGFLLRGKIYAEDGALLIDVRETDERELHRVEVGHRLVGDEGGVARGEPGVLVGDDHDGPAIAAAAGHQQFLLAGHECLGAPQPRIAVDPGGQARRHAGPVEHDERRIGGAGSVAHDLVALEAKAVLVGVVGEDTVVLGKEKTNFLE
jgi:hypothetical protein